MADIKLTDNFGLSVDVVPTVDSSFMKYFKSLPSLQALGANIGAIQQIPLKQVQLESGSVGLTFQEPVAIGTTGTALTIGAGLYGTISICKDDPLFSDDDFGDPIAIPPDQAYLSLGMKATVSSELTADAAGLTFGFSPATEVSVSNYKPFTTTSSEPKFVEALRETLSEYCIPAQVSDMETLASGTIATLGGTGKLKFSATANLLSSINPLATLSAPVLPVSLQVTEGASVEVGASFELSGGYQVRVQKLNQRTVRLGYYTEHGSEFRVGVAAKLDVSAGVGSFDVVSDLLGLISSDPKADVDELKRAGLNEDQIEAIANAIKAAIERKLELAVYGELALASQKESAFLYEIDLNALDTAGRQAVNAALRGDLTALLEGENSLPKGVRLVHTIFTAIRKSKHRLKINLLGIYNYISVSRLTLQGAILYEPESGDLVITDSANAQRIRSAQINFGADRDKLRRVLAESFLITAVYKCSQFIARAPQLNSGYWYFDLQPKANQQTMKGNLDVPEALGMISEQQKQSMLAGTEDFGRCTFYAETNYGDEVTTTLFLDGAGQPRSEDEYDKIGREALRCLIHAGDDDDFRLPPLQDNSLWARMKDAGPAALSGVLPGLPAAQVAVIATDYTVIRWWSHAMRSMGEKLVDIRRFFAQNSAPNPEDATFKALREELANAMASVARNTKEEFGHPWGLLAMDRASDSKADAIVRIIATRLSFEMERSKPELQIAAAG